MIQNILVAGGTGRTGRIIVEKLRQQGFTTHVLVRDIDSGKALLGEGVIFHQTDVRNLQTLEGVMQNIDALISAVGSQTPVGKNCPKRVDFQGVANLLNTAKMHRVQRFILISSLAVTRPNHPLNCFGKVLDWKLKGEEVVRNSGLNYVILRPGGLKDTPGGTGQLVFDQDDNILGTISREDIAEICVKALVIPNIQKVTFEIIEGDQKQDKITNWLPLLSSLVPD